MCINNQVSSSSSSDEEVEPAPERCPHGSRSLPGQPRILCSDHDGIQKFLLREFCSDYVERMSPWLWMMSLQSSSNISPLHRQRVKGREIIVTEDPKMHLVWYYDHIFIKPLPRYLVSQDFWNEFLLYDSSPLGPSRGMIFSAVLGYMRTWIYLIAHESDFRIAQDKTLQLIPDDLNWTGFCHITARLPEIKDEDVSARYHYGEIRLTRLNFYAKFILRRGSYQRMHGQYAPYFASLTAPLLFAFGMVSVLLNCMQVILAVEQVDPRHWVNLWSICRWFSLVSSIFLVGMAIGLMALFLFKVSAEWKKALTDRRRLTRGGRVRKEPFLYQGPWIMDA